MSESRIAFSCVDGVARIVFDDAARHNVIGSQFTRELAAAAMACEADPTLRLVLLTARGKAFSVGAEPNEFLRERARACRPTCARWRPGSISPSRS